MSQNGAKAGQAPQQSDALLWLGGAIIAGLGVTWLLLERPWVDADLDARPAAAATSTAGSSTAATSPAVDTPASAPIASAPAAGVQTARADLETPLEDNPLRMAELAYEAGMLVEPEEYSAWALYQRALEQDPESEAARRGLEKIADDLLRRASVAVEQGRFDDALATIQRIRSAIPAHPGANELAFRIDALRPEPAPPPRAAQSEREADDAEPARAAAAPAREQAAEAAPARAEPQVDPVLEPYARFGEALAANRLLTPVGSSARFFLDMMITLDPDHELTREALDRFSSELLSRANAAIIELDSAAAETWLDEASRLGVKEAEVADARDRLRRRLIDAESARRVPVSALVVAHYVPPEFPARALERALEGWVDVEFTVGRDGTTRDIVVIDASHNSFFRREAIEAVQQWRFEPRVFLGQVIEQRAYTRIRFTLNE
ncbi:MAG TPA: energy transducer TonB [Gammaproteobacteria bacterium]